MVSLGGGSSVLLRGFDFGTSEDQIRQHMSSVGFVQSIQLRDQGSACVTYSSGEEAKAAVAQLNQTNIAGNKRYLDVLLMDPNAFIAGHTIDPDKAQQFLEMPPDQQQAVMAKGTLATARDPTAVLVQRMKQARVEAPVQLVQFFGSDGGMSGGASGSDVLVRGFDFGTTDAQIRNHMSSVGPVQSLQWIDNGSVKVTYSSAEESQYAVQQLQSSNIPGNKRYLDVLIMDPIAFLAGHNIDTRRAEQFKAMTPEEQHAVMARGSLATARDPTAVLATRMQQVNEKGVGKGSYGPAKGGGGAMTGGMANGPYGGGGGGDMGQGGDQAAPMQNMMQMMQMLMGMMGGMEGGNGGGIGMTGGGNGEGMGGNGW